MSAIGLPPLYQTDGETSAYVWGKVHSALQQPYDDVVGRTAPDAHGRPSSYRRTWTLAERLTIYAYITRALHPFATCARGYGWGLEALARERCAARMEGVAMTATAVHALTAAVTKFVHHEVDEHVAYSDLETVAPGSDPVAWAADLSADLHALEAEVGIRRGDAYLLLAHHCGERAAARVRDRLYTLYHDLVCPFCQVPSVGDDWQPE